MLLGKVVGTVVATKKEAELTGLRFLLVRELDAQWQATGKVVVAVDAVDAGDGEIVLFAAGSSARLTVATISAVSSAVTVRSTTPTPTRIGSRDARWRVCTALRISLVIRSSPLTRAAACDSTARTGAGTAPALRRRP